MSPARRLRPPPPLPSERTRNLTFRTQLGDVELILKALAATADRAERAAAQLHDLAPELRARAARLRRIAALLDREAVAVR
jgi:hypothetical protein